MTPEQEYDNLRGIVSALAASVVAHDNQIEALTKAIDKEHETVLVLARVVEKNTTDIDRLSGNMDELRELVRNVTRQWQAYLNRLPPQ